MSNPPTPLPLNKSALRRRLRTMARSDVLTLLFICFRHLDPGFEEIEGWLTRCMPWGLSEVFAHEFAESHGIEIEPDPACPRCGSKLEWKQHLTGDVIGCRDCDWEHE